MNDIFQQKSDISIASEELQQQKDYLAEFLLCSYPKKETQKEILRDLKQFNCFFTAKSGKNLFSPKAFDLGIYRQNLIDQGYKPSTVNRKLSSLKSFYRYLHEVGFNSSNIAHYLKLLKLNSKVGSTPAFTETQLKRLFDSFDDEKDLDLRDKLFCAIAFFCAARVSAICNIKFEDILKEESGVKIRLHEKNGKIRYLHCNSQILAPTLKKFLERVSYSEGFIFRTMRKGNFTESKMCRVTAHLMIKKRCKRIGIDDKFSCHSFRSSFATLWIEKNHSITSLQKIGAWESLDVVKRYDRQSNEASIGEMETLKL